MALVKSVRVALDVTGEVTAKAKIDAISARAEELKKQFPEFKVKIDTAAAQAKLALFRREVKASGDEAARQGEARGGFGILSRAVGFLGSVIGGGGGAGEGAAGAGIPAGAALVPAIAAAIPVIAGLGTIAAGAATGIGGFGAVAIPVISDLKDAMTTVSTANENFSQAAGLVDTALKTSAADSKDYSDALKSMPPNLASAAKLLGNQDVTWQGLTKAQRNNVVALSQNKDALKTLFPAQKESLAALLASKKAWDGLSPAQQRAATGLGQVQSAFEKMAKVFQPAVLGVVSQVAKLLTGPTGAIAQVGVIVEESLPGIRQMVAILGKGFLGFLKGMQPLILPSLGAFNMLLAAIMKNLPQLFRAMAQGMPAWIQLARGVAAVLAFGIRLTAWLVELSSWVILRTVHQLHVLEGYVDSVRAAFIRFGHDTEASWNSMDRQIHRASHDIVAGVGIAWDELKLLTLQLVDHMLRAFERIPLIGGMFHSAERAVHREIGAIQADINRLEGKTVHVNLDIGQLLPPGTMRRAAGGWRVPGFGGGDRWPALLEGGETVVDKDRSRMFAPLFRAAGVPGYAGGGAVGLGERTAFHPSLAAVWRQLNSGVTSVASSAARSMGAALLSGAGGNVTSWLLTALGIDRAPLSWLPAEQQLVSRESGGNALARNPVSVLGQHASGLLQMLPSTFNAYRLFGSIWDPIANAVSSIRYQRAVYGSPYNIAGLFGGTYYGYGKGGLVPRMQAGGLIAGPGGLYATTGNAAAGEGPGGSLRRMQALAHATLAGLQKLEVRDYLGLRDAFRVSLLAAEHTPGWLRKHHHWQALRFGLQHPRAMGWLHVPAHRKWVTADLVRLAGLQEKEAAAFSTATAGDVTAAALRALGGGAHTEAAALLTSPLGHHPGGHPGWVAGLGWWLGSLQRAAGVGRMALAQESRIYDSGGWLPPGASVAVNATGRPERVGGPATVIYNITVNAGPGTHPAETGRAVVTALKEYEKRSGKGWRT